MSIAKKNIQALYKLPAEPAYCKRCVVSNQRPRIHFDAEGVCSACRFAERKAAVIDWKDRKRQLQELCDRHRKTDGSYDVLVPGSGGKDGSFVAHTLKHDFGMHPLTATWAPHIYTEIGFKNLQSFVAHGFDNVLFSPDGQVHRMLTRLALEDMGDPFQPFIFGQCSFPFRTALHYDIKLVFYGEDGEVEYGGSMEHADRPSLPWDTFVKNRFSGITPERFADRGLTVTQLQKYALSGKEMETLQQRGVQQHFFSYYHKWLPQENFYYAAKNTGLEANPAGRSEGTYSKYASLDDRIDGFHYYLMFLKFGIGRATSDAAHEIRDGHISRDEAVALVRKYDGEFPKKHFQEFLNYCSISEETFWEIANSWRADHLWERRDGAWHLRTQVS